MKREVQERGLRSFLKNMFYIAPGGGLHSPSNAVKRSDDDGQVAKEIEGEGVAKVGEEVDKLSEGESEGGEDGWGGEDKDLAGFEGEDVDGGEEGVSEGKSVVKRGFFSWLKDMFTPSERNWGRNP